MEVNTRDLFIALDYTVYLFGPIVLDPVDKTGFMSLSIFR